MMEIENNEVLDKKYSSSVRFCHLIYHITKIPSYQFGIDNWLTPLCNVVPPVQIIRIGFSFFVSCFTTPVAKLKQRIVLAYETFGVFWVFAHLSINIFCEKSKLFPKIKHCCFCSFLYQTPHRHTMQTSRRDDAQWWTDAGHWKQKKCTNLKFALPTISLVSKILQCTRFQSLQYWNGERRSKLLEE